MVVSIWVLDITQVIISGVVAAGVAAIVGGDVAVATGGSGLKRRGCGVCRGVVDQPGSQCHCLAGAGGGFGAGDEVIVVVINIVDSIDGGCAGVVSNDMAAFTGMGRLVTGAVGAGGSLQACEAVSQVLGSSVDVPMSLSKCGSTSVAVCIAESMVEVVVIWEAISAVMVAIWVMVSVVSQVWGVNTSREAQRPSPWFDTHFSFSSWRPCFFPSSITSSILSSTSIPHCR